MQICSPTAAVFGSNLGTFCNFIDIFSTRIGWSYHINAVSGTEGILAKFSVAIGLGWLDGRLPLIVFSSFKIPCLQVRQWGKCWFFKNGNLHNSVQNLAPLLLRSNVETNIKTKATGTNPGSEAGMCILCPLTSIKKQKITNQSTNNAMDLMNFLDFGKHFSGLDAWYCR